MKRTLAWILGAVAAVALGVVVWFYATTGVDDATADVTAPTLAAEQQTPDSSSAAPTSSEAQGTLTETTPHGTGASTTAPTGGVVYALAPESTVTFELDEVLRGVDSRVVATNDEVEGQLRVDPTDLGATELGTIVIGAQTFETDSSNRDRAIRGPILDAGTFPRITFEPTSIDGLEGDVSVGEQVEFSVTGDLTIRDVTQEVTFDVTATLTAEDRIEGRAMSTVSREAFGLTIPSVASVANVSDEVDVAIDFVATPA